MVLSYMYMEMMRIRMEASRMKKPLLFPPPFFEVFHINPLTH